MTRQVNSWGNYPGPSQDAEPCHWSGQLPDLLAAGCDSTLPFGAGRSYGDSCLAASGRVIATAGLDRWLEADWQTGIVKVESGVTLDEILRQAIPRGWFLPVVPGTAYATAGGAVANDVHGKNHHRRGSFGAHLLGFSMVRSESGELQCTPDSPLFATTIGGLGLTGVITSVEIQLMPISSSEIEHRQLRFSNLGEFLQLSRELDTSHEYTVAWLDCSSRRGRGLFSAGNHASSGPLRHRGESKLSLPITPPFSLLNRATVPALNTLWYHSHRERVVTTRCAYRSFFFPLDGVGQWNRSYGPRGFQQYQCVLPHTNAQGALQQLLDLIARAGGGSFLSVLKQCGEQTSPGLLSFPMPGISLALDFPQKPGLDTLFRDMDQTVAEAGGRLYPAKDAHMSATDFQRAYPAWRELEAQRDPALNSRFWQRVTGSGDTRNE